MCQERHGTRITRITVLGTATLRLDGPRDARSGGGGCQTDKPVDSVIGVSAWHLPPPEHRPRPVPIQPQDPRDPRPVASLVAFYSSHSPVCLLIIEPAGHLVLFGRLRVLRVSVLISSPCPPYSPGPSSSQVEEHRLTIALQPDFKGPLVGRFASPLRQQCLPPIIGHEAE